MNLAFLFSVCSILVIVDSAGLNEEFTWTRITYDWPKSGRSKRQDSIVFDGETNAESGRKLTTQAPKPSYIEYIFENNVPMGANVWKNKLFITVPRRRLGIPSTLNYVPLDSPVRHNVPLIPYPSWQNNLYPVSGGNTDNLFSIYRIAIDPCDRLWAVDTGTLELVGNWTQVKPTTIIAIDLNTDRIIHRHEIPTTNLKPASSLASLKVDVTKETCNDAYLYIPDLSGYGLVVYSLKENRSWRVKHNYFYLESTAGEFSIAGYNFQLSDGIFSVELSKIQPDGFRNLFFHSLAGTRIYKVSTKILRNETLATRSYHGNDFRIFGDRSPNSQTSQADIHQPSGIMFQNFVNQNAVACWNTNKPLNSISVVQRNDQKMIYPSDVKVVNDKVYVLTNTMPKFLFGRLNYDETNFRVWSNTVEAAIQGTKCE